MYQYSQVNPDKRTMKASKSVNTKKNFGVRKKGVAKKAKNKHERKTKAYIGQGK